MRLSVGRPPTHLSFPVSPFLMGVLLATALVITPLPSVQSAGLGVTPPEQFSVPDGFAVELVYEVPSETQGSWVSLTTDPKGRLIACDQYGSLYRIDVSKETASVEKLDIDVQGAHGLLCAFGSLYANVNDKPGVSGVYRLTDTDGDDQYDKKEHILPLFGRGEHGPHALILTQDRKRILVCCGNNTDLPENIARSRVPRVWQEDHLLGRMPDARGHNAGRLAPGGFVGSFNPDGSEFELIATGFRNEFDIALNQSGELFTYDADMEWDVGTPWYRPTRVNHVISGAEFGWRNGTGKWPAYYPDSFGSAVDIGPGSPTGICFGYGTQYPAKYQNALFIADWSYGNIHAVHLTPDGSTYTGEYETFATAAPLPVTDMVVHPGQGALYFAIGGRRTQSGLYRIVYRGDDKSSANETQDSQVEMRARRAELESLHLAGPSDEAVEKAIGGLNSDDRAIRFVARIALEHQPVDSWREKVGEIDDDHARTLAVIALARHGNASDQGIAFRSLRKVNWKKLPAEGKIALLRAYGLVAMRLKPFNEKQKQAILNKIGGSLPTGENEVDRELAQVLIHLDAPGVVEQVVGLMNSAPSQEDQIHYALALRDVTNGWTDDLRRDYFKWFQEMASARGGMSFGGFLDNIKSAAVEKLSDDQRKQLASVLAAPKQESAEETLSQRELVKKWTVEELADSLAKNDHTLSFERGKDVFSKAQCYKCHRMGVQGGILGPDLTGAGGRFNVKDLLVSMIEPDKVISDQYGSTQFLTVDGDVIVGRVVNMSGDQLRVMTNMLDPSAQTMVKRSEIEATQPSKSSMMPGGLLDTFTEEEINDLIAYLRAGGRESHPIYKD